MRKFLAALGISLFVICSPAIAAQGGNPLCSLSVVSEPGINQGYVADSLTNLHPITGGFKYYLAALSGPLGGPQQISYFRPTGTTWTALFLNEGPGIYHATLLDVVDNQKGPAKEEILSTSCTTTFMKYIYRFQYYLHARRRIRKREARL